MEIKYVGPKPLISQHGITFDNNKVDKFSYLNILMQLLHAIDHEYHEDQKYTYNTSTKRLEHETLIQTLHKYCPNIEEVVCNRDDLIEEDIAQELQDARDNRLLKPEEKEALENNIKLMHDYIVQRGINKAVYYEAIKALAELILVHKIEHIVVPMYEKFIHILHSLQGVLKAKRHPVDTNLEIYQENDNLLAKLTILYK